MKGTRSAGTRENDMLGRDGKVLGEDKLAEGLLN